MPSVVVIGAGVFGASVADRLARAGWEVTLVDRFEPGHLRAESGGETRLIRCCHGPDAFYARSARRALELWRELGEGVLVESGVTWFARREDGWEADSERVLRGAGIPVERMSPEEGARLFPSVAVDDLAFVLHEPEAGVLRAADGVRALVRRACEAGARVVIGEAEPDGDRVRLANGAPGRPAASGGAPGRTAARGGAPGRTAARGGAPARAAVGRAPGDASAGRLEADFIVWACGAWLGKLFPQLVPMRVTFQQLVLFEAPPEWNGAGWVDFDAAFYGHARVEGVGFKVGPDIDGAEVDPDTRPLEATAGGIAIAREYLGMRFPAMAGAPVASAPGCHYGLTPDGQFLFARHPEHPNVWLLGGGSGHGYKHGPALAEHVEAVLTGRENPEPRFALGERAPARSLRTAGATP
ncbi:MAG TPA: FAD-dependent oxidoreductase [Thermoleophilaceae bacterium]|nr:FAD-dependent oxidoreductase [Thermoleophilaceae bacterium]